MKVTPELIARLVESAYAGQAEGIDLPTAKNDAISAVFGGGSPSRQASEPVKVNVIKALASASTAELADLETKLLAAERAPHLNGEAKELELAVNRLTSRIKF